MTGVRDGALVVRGTGAPVRVAAENVPPRDARREPVHVRAPRAERAGTSPPAERSPNWPGNSLGPGASEPVEVLLIEDDPGDALLVEELLGEAGAQMRVVWARTLTDAEHRLTARTGCVLLDLVLPDAVGMQGLHRVLSLAPWAAVIVLTGLDDAHSGVQALSLGAEDYLVKNEVHGALLSRAVRYGIERKRAEESQRRLVEAELLAQENARLERGLLPVPLLDDPTISYRTRYRPGRRRALLGGDFYDMVQSPDGAMHLVIGDVSGHGPDEAALGVCLRVAWRTLVLTGRWGGGLLSTLEQVLVAERRSDEVFATVCTVTVEPSRRFAWLHLAGHPTPLVIRRSGGERTVRMLPDDLMRPALGVTRSARWTGAHVELGDDWSLLLYTDGLIEGRVGEGPERLGTEGLCGLVHEQARGIDDEEALINAIILAVEQLHGGALTDDLAMLLLSRRRDS